MQAMLSRRLLGVRTSGRGISPGKGKLNTKKKYPGPQRFSGEKEIALTVLLQWSKKKEQECLMWRDEAILGPPAVANTFIIAADLPLV